MLSSRHSQIREMFRKAYGGNKTNFMTPYIVGYQECAKYVYEVSKGKNDDIFGVSVLDLETGEKSPLSTCFDTLGHANGFIKDTSEGELK